MSRWRRAGYAEDQRLGDTDHDDAQPRAEQRARMPRAEAHTARHACRLGERRRGRRRRLELALARGAHAHDEAGQPEDGPHAASPVADLSATQRGRRGGGVGGRMLASLGPMPAAERPSERAIWVAALICPCGTDRASWPVLDIRPEVLAATTPMERLAAAKMGLVDSIYKLKGGNWPMSTYFWQ